MVIDPLSLIVGFLCGAVLAFAAALFYQRRSRDAFKAVSAEALAANNQQFLNLAEQHLARFQEAAKGDLDKRSTAIETTFAPVTKTLETLTQHLNEVEKIRVGAYEGLRQQVSSLAETQAMLKGETGRLVQALRTPMGRGMWGEMQLDRLLEMAGMIEGMHFHRQPNLETDDGRQRPDIVISLPGGKSIVIDAKTPLDAYLSAIEAETEEQRHMHLISHARQVRTQMSKLADKKYWKQFPASPEFVIMFIPSEGASASALQSDLEMIEAGMRDNVVIATPLTLFALLRSIVHGWRQERIAENAIEIGRLGRELYEQMSTMGGNFETLGKQLGKSVETYNKTLGQVEKKLLVTARKLKERHEVSTPVEIPMLNALEDTPRSLSSLELLTSGDEV